MNNLYSHNYANLIGKRITHIVTIRNRTNPPMQVFIIFDDHTHCELYGHDIDISSRLYSGGLAQVEQYAQARGGDVVIYPDATQQASVPDLGKLDIRQ